MVYIDLFAGSGLCKIKDSDDFLAGSPILVAALAKRQFDKYILVDMDPDFCSALNKRMAQFGVYSKYYEADSNIAINDIIGELSPQDHYLAFVDCQTGFEFQWDSLMKLLSRQGDLIFNFQSVTVYREVKQYQENPTFEPRKLMALYGDDRWVNYQSRDDCLEGFIQKIKSETNREIVIPLIVRGPNNYQYDLLVATKRTAGGSPWMNPMREIQQKFHKLESKIAQTVIDVLKGRKKTLSDFY